MSTSPPSASATSSPPRPLAESGRRPGRPRQGAADHGEVAERLLDAATELAAEQGFDACGLREIAARAEVSSGMIAYYFGDRQGLYDAMFQRAFDRIAQRMLDLLDGLPDDADDRLDQLLRLHVSTVAADPLLPKLILRELLSGSKSVVKTELAGRVGRGPMRTMIQRIEEEQARGILRADLDPAMMAMTLAGISAFPFLLLPIFGEEIGLTIDASYPERLIEHNQRLLSGGLRAPEKRS